MTQPNGSCKSIASEHIGSAVWGHRYKKIPARPKPGGSSRAIALSRKVSQHYRKEKRDVTGKNTCKFRANPRNFTGYY